jgi:U3 small nucleolar RNA-associated protein 21
MLNKRLGKHTFGFVDDIKGKGKERVPLGSVKVSKSVTFQGISR